MRVTTGHPTDQEQAVDVPTLHALTEDLATYLSEVTVGDLRQPTHDTSGDVGELYLHLIDQNVQVATAITGEAIPHGQWHDPMDRTSLSGSADTHGSCGLETGYRQTASLMESAFASAVDSATLYELPGHLGAVDLRTLYELQVSSTVVHTWDVAQALGLPYRPSPSISQRVLKTIAREAPHLLRSETPPAGASDHSDAFACALKLLGRAPRAPRFVGPRDGRVPDP